MAAILATTYWRILIEWVVHLWDDPNYSFGLLVLPMSVYLVWSDRRALLEVPARPSLWGLPALLGGIAALFVASLGAELFLGRVSLLVISAAAILFLRGWASLRLVATPLVLLLLSIPLPQLVFANIAVPLQLMASHLSEEVLHLLSIPVLREGNIIYLPAITLGVVEACSGLRSIFSLLALSILYGHFLEPRRWLRLLLMAASVFIALAVNMVRIVGTGVLAQFGGSDTAEGFFHYFYGWLHFVTALGFLFLVHQLCLRAVAFSKRRAQA